jgi:hypothetical protein
MFTFCPDPANNLSLLKLVSNPDKQFNVDNEFHNMCEDELKAILQHVGSDAQRKMAVTEDPASVAFYYDFVVKAVIEIIIGWDVKTQSPTGKRGLFGTPLGYMVSTESQGTGNLVISP